MVRLVVIAALAFLGCGGLPPQAFVDGYPVGEPVACDDPCDRFSDFALATLKRSVPDHAPVVEVLAYVPDYRTSDGQGRLLTSRSGGHDLIMVLRLADGSVRAFYIACGVGVEPDRCSYQPPR